ncbi:MAG: carbohydrate-binding domain-containing protein [Ruminococcus sp.]|nr:carbohydrate-binding domain-containing protein [Ruminococcus sp.]
MMKLKKTLALLTGTLLLCTAYSCGQTDITETESKISAASDGVSGSDSLTEIEKNDSEVKESDKEKSTQNATKNTEDSTAENSSEPTSESASANSKATSPADENESDESNSSDEEQNEAADSEASDESVNDSPASGNSSSGEASNSGGNSSSSNQNSGSASSNNSNSSNSSNNSNSQQNQSNSSSSSNNSSSSNTNSGGSSEVIPTEPATEAPTEAPTEPEKVYAAEITLGDTPQINGSNAAADGSRVVITGGGDFLISGSVADGQIEVNTKEKVKIFLDGVSITSYSGPAIKVTDAKRFILVLKEGTHSVLQDVNVDNINDGVICSNDTVEIKGNGSLDIIAGNAHGISSDDDVVLENGTINITSVKSGIIANDDVTINDVISLNIYGGTNGIKSKGTLNINGGYTVISGGAKEEKSSIYAAGAFNYTGGYVYAAGNVVSAPTSSVNPYIVAGFSTAQPAGSTVSVQLDGWEYASLVPHNNFKCVMMLAPEIAVGSTFALNVNGAQYGDYSVADVQNIFTITE